MHSFALYSDDDIVVARERVKAAQLFFAAYDALQRHSEYALNIHSALPEHDSLQRRKDDAWAVRQSQSGFDDSDSNSISNSDSNSISNSDSNHDSNSISNSISNSYAVVDSTPEACLPLLLRTARQLAYQALAVLRLLASPGDPDLLDAQQLLDYTS